MLFVPSRSFDVKAVCSNPRQKREACEVVLRIQAERVALSAGLKCVFVRTTDRRHRTKKGCLSRNAADRAVRREHPFNFQWTLKGRSNEFRNH